MDMLLQHFGFSHPKNRPEIYSSAKSDYRINLFYICTLIFADVLKLVDKPVLGTGALRREGSSPFIRTQKTRSLRDRVFYFLNPTSAHRDLCLYSGVIFSIFSAA